LWRLFAEVRAVTENTRQHARPAVAELAHEAIRAACTRAKTAGTQNVEFRTQNVEVFFVLRLKFCVRRSAFPVPHSPSFILRSTFPILHPSFCVLRSAFYVLRSTFGLILWCFFPAGVGTGGSTARDKNSQQFIGFTKGRFQ
jgi:hypothetical protein